MEAVLVQQPAEALTPAPYPYFPCALIHPHRPILQRFRHTGEHDLFRHKGWLLPVAFVHGVPVKEHPSVHALRNHTLDGTRAHRSVSFPHFIRHALQNKNIVEKMIVCFPHLPPCGDKRFDYVFLHPVFQKAYATPARKYGQNHHASDNGNFPHPLPS